MDDPIARIVSRSAVAGVIGLGYVGLPILAAAARAGFRSIGFDVDSTKVDFVNAGKSYIDAVSADELRELIRADRLSATFDFGRLGDCDVLVICVPTPLTRHREPDLSFVETTARSIAGRLRSGQLIVLESTSYPGTTREVVKPILEAAGLRSGVDFLLAFSPEREDPGNKSFSTITIPKVVGGDGALAQRSVEAFYSAIINRVVPVSSMEVAEAVKITENVFRAVNIALVNELKMIFDRMDIDVWEVIEAAKTKPFGFMPFYPGPGLGGHCIPIDPFYLSWKSREFEIPTRFIELAGEINVGMPAYVVRKLEEALDRRFAMSLGATRVLIVGLAYKKNVADVRESPAFKIWELLEKRGCGVSYHDPHVSTVPSTREHGALAGCRSVPLDAGTIDAADAVIIATDHDAINYALIAARGRLVIDTRNVLSRQGYAGVNVVKA